MNIVRVNPEGTVIHMIIECANFTRMLPAEARALAAELIGAADEINPPMSTPILDLRPCSVCGAMVFPTLMCPNCFGRKL